MSQPIKMLFHITRKPFRGELVYLMDTNHGFTTDFGVLNGLVREALKHDGFDGPAVELENKVVDYVRQIIKTMGDKLYAEPGAQISKTELNAPHLDEPVTAIFINDDAFVAMSRQTNLAAKTEAEAIALFESLRERVDRDAMLESPLDPAPLDKALAEGAESRREMDM